jgi:hypothetical protein
MPCWHINEETHPLDGVNIQKILQLEGTIGPLKIDHNKTRPLPNLQLLQQPHEKEQLVKLNQFEWG